MKNIFKNIALVLSTLVVSAIVGCAVLAWTEPGSPAPAGNVAAPINTGLTSQTKSGELNLGNLNVSGNVGIGKTAPGYKLDMNGTLRVTGTVTNAGPNYGGYFSVGYGSLTSPGPINYAGYFDAYGGYATNYGIYVNRGMSYFGGNVGIGTASPGAKLEVNGQIKIAGGNPAAGKVLTSDAGGLAMWTNAAQTKNCPASQSITAYDATTGTFTCGTGSCSPDCAGKACGADDGCGNPCQTGFCAAGICNEGICKTCKMNATTCSTPSDCCSGSCQGGFCAPAPSPCVASPTEGKRIFVTSSQYLGSQAYGTTKTNSAEIKADNLCVSAAQTANLPNSSNFKALLYAGKRDISQVLKSGPYYNGVLNETTGLCVWKLVARDFADFLQLENGSTTNFLKNPIAGSNLGTAMDVNVWTDFKLEGGGYTLVNESNISFRLCGVTVGCGSGGCNDSRVNLYFLRQSNPGGFNTVNCVEYAYYYGLSNSKTETWAEKRSSTSSGPAANLSLYCVEQ